jgi:hypothetical protein
MKFPAEIYGKFKQNKQEKKLQNKTQFLKALHQKAFNMALFFEQLV